MDNYDLDLPIIEFKNENPLTIRDLCNSVGVFGGVGSGKSSGSGRYISLKMLCNNFSGLVLTCKEDECDQWREYCRITGRSKDLIIVKPKNKYYFNVLEYLSTQDSEKTFTKNIVEVLRTVLNAKQQKDGSKTDDTFWKTALEMLLTHVIDLCILSSGKVNISQLYDIALSITKEDEDSDFVKALTKAKQNVADKMDTWTMRVGQAYLDSMDDVAYNEALFKAVPEARKLKLMDQFFTVSYRNISAKTRTTIEFMFIGFVFSLLQDPLYSLFFDRPSNFKPEDCLDGKIIIIDLPVKTYNEVGRDIQIMFKYIWQRSMEKRNINENGRPLFIYADEAQHFIHEYDAEFQATSRGIRICNIVLSQNLPNYYSAMGGEKSEYRVKSFLGTLGTKIFHANADTDTNKYASELIGDAWQKDDSSTVTNSNGAVSTAQTITVKLQRMVRPEDFSSLKSGSPVNQNRVSAYIHVQGKKFSKGFSHHIIHLDQNFIPKLKPKN